MVLFIPKVIGYLFIYSCFTVTFNNSFKSDLKVYLLIMSDGSFFFFFISQLYKMFLLPGNTISASNTKYLRYMHTE